MIKKQIESKIIKNIEAIELNDRIAVVKLETVTVTNASESKMKVEGIANIDVLNKWNGTEDLVFNQYSLVDSSVIEKYKKYGMPDSSLAKHGWDYEALEKATSKTPFTDHKKGLTKGKEFICISGYDHSLTLMNGTVVSKPMYFNYIEARIDNENYDLEKLAELIYKRDDVFFYSDKKRNGSFGPLTDEQCAGLIQPIPYYNVQEGRTETIEFTFCLAQDKFDKMLKDLGKKDGSHERIAYIAENDLLGIESARHQKVEEVFTSKKKSRFR